MSPAEKAAPHPRRPLWLWPAAVFLATFFLVTLATYFVYQNQEKEEKLKAAYAAESTVSRVSAQLSRYLAESDLIRQIIEQDNGLSKDLFDSISRLMQDSDGVIEAHELARQGIVSQIYPLNGNEAALGLDMLRNPARRKEATLAKNSGQYTIAGPFELVQGGTGALLFEPIYTTVESGAQTFWGFSILVLRWDRFIEIVELSKLEEAGYRYQIWKEDPNNGKKIVIAESENFSPRDTLETACTVPNDTWYFEIAPAEGWVSGTQVSFGMLLAFLLAAAMATGVWQVQQRQLRDAQHEAALERSAQEARAANEAKTRFLFNMSHDIRTPMNAIIGFSELLEQHPDEPDRVRIYTEKIHASSSFLLSLINQVLEMARIESGKAELQEEPGSINVLVDTLAAVFEPTVQQKGLHYHAFAQVTHPYILCDTTKVREILLNLLSNSIKYTPAGGSVQLTITELPAGTPDAALYQFVVEDTGIGMSKEYLPHIFEEFTRERTSTESHVTGTGLGLPIVKALVDQMHGTIGVESAPGQGTHTTLQFRFALSSEDAYRAKNPPAAPAGSAAPLAGRRILLAEDNDLNAEIALTLLEENGLLAERVSDGRLCLEAVQAHPIGFYDAILMDIQMPNMDGYAAARAIRALPDARARIPILAMTANAFDEDRRKALDAGMNAHLAKPISAAALLEALQSVL